MRPLCAQPLMGDGGAGYSPALLKIQGTGASWPLLQSGVQGECVQGKGTISHIFHLTNHRQFVFKHFSYCCGGNGPHRTNLPLPLPRLTPQHTAGLWGWEPSCAWLSAGLLRVPACSYWNPWKTEGIFPKASGCLHEVSAWPQLGSYHQLL